MIISMKKGATPQEISHVRKLIEELGYKVHESQGSERMVFGAIGDERSKHRLTSLEAQPGVEKVIPILAPYKLASRETKQESTVIDLGHGVKVGNRKLLVIAGPCAVESQDQIMEVAAAMKECGAHMLRGGAFKPRTSPYAFQGLMNDGLYLLAKAREAYSLPVITEVMDTASLEIISEHADCLQVGARNIQNFQLLKEVGKTRKPVLLKRGMSTTIEEFLMSAEYVLSNGNHQVILCERGIRTFETATRNTLDLSAVPVLKEKTHLPVIVDPSHGTGHARYVMPMAYAAVAAGADGLMIEVHPRPEEALSDGPQSLRPNEFKHLMEGLRRIASAVDRDI
ncbi:MAG: Phospho-2-dehydro-3-deoxyheptonate aldolase [Deltaproteobacteria bacterium ADurb.BinA179]|jgi:3-deoxy-7-phosphoheptulonate synthase|nr:3-deoxy-7-phosphoheptulonate synthase [Deltaproteobacteria bacterium]MDI9543162.1 3-deoxy-7-phosphoheptulonate synthase [Pseudomonadota bacterium]NLW66566.1 3-deoxy-7-phosphoheptulonate synthase [Bacteriovoracaceae bacterium]OPZ25960.1 MAG: Phospho-2-dehydro-3-deoxyheptonate aldolase [Deltaproteobacteria bacterium ADurb.BinA179]HRR21057.1 3-deoxy-7-phosphoheptulonate synthase [Desulfomonilia bacterium]